MKRLAEHPLWVVFAGLFFVYIYIIILIKKGMNAYHMSSETQKLLKLSCKTAKTFIEVYADMLAAAEKTICAARFAGEPEQVQAMMDCMGAGATICVGEDDSFMCKTKQDYVKYITKNEKYAEGLFFLKDDPLRTISLQEQEEEEKTAEGKRNIYLFCRQKEDLFAELNRKVTVPLLPEFEPYFMEELDKKGLIHEMTVFSPNVPFYGWYLTVSNDENELAEILNTGLKNGMIQIPGGIPKVTAIWNNISNFTAYLKNFGVQVAAKIKERFHPLYDPEKEPISQEVLSVNRHIMHSAGYSLFDAQLGTAESLKRQLERDKLALLIAECGSGKTKIGATSLYAYQHRDGKTANHFNVICCPSHICEKWVREITETLPNTFAAVVQSITDVNHLYSYYQEHQQDVYCVLSKEQARDGPMRYPTVHWSKRKRGFVCPKCGKVIKNVVEGISITAGADFFLNENSGNHQCPSCGEILWSVYNPWSTSFNEWVRIGEYGFVHRKFALRDFELAKSEILQEKLKYVLAHPDEYIPAVGAYRKYPLSAYIKRKIPKVDGVIIDELHQYSGESAQGQAMADLTQKADKVVGMTATLLNGYAKGLFYLLFRLKPRLMLMDSQKYEKPRQFCSEYGILQQSITLEKAAEFNVKSKVKKSRTREKFLPGISPLVYCRFLLENAAFLSLNDMGKDLPEYEEIPVPCHMPYVVNQAYTKMETILKKTLVSDPQLGNKLMSTYLNLLSVYPDQPYGHDPIPHPLGSEYEPILKIPNTASPEDVMPKDEKVLELVDRKVKAGERVIIYTAWTRLDTHEKLKKLLSARGYRVSVLTANIPAKQREKWVDKKVREGIDVLIVNPALVETGLDLNAFTTLIFYNIAYNLYVFRQASRRSWRINQTAPRIEVYMLYYRETMQERALKLMASKLMAATVIEGNISEEGLAAMSNCEDMISELARQLVSEIKDEVDDLAVSFQKMAIRHSDNIAQDEAEVKQMIAPDLINDSRVAQQEKSVKNTVWNIGFTADQIPAFIRTKQRRKKALEDFAETGQVNLFDLLAS